MGHPGRAAKLETPSPFCIRLPDFINLTAHFDPPLLAPFKFVGFCVGFCKEAKTSRNCHGTETVAL
jgi:hypothetical protein